MKESLKKKIAQDASLSVLSRSKSIAQGWGAGQSVVRIQEEKSRWAPEGRPSSLKSVNDEDGLSSDCLEGDSKAHRDSPAAARWLTSVS